jgi:hypothetical protein
VPRDGARVPNPNSHTSLSQFRYVCLPLFCLSCIPNVFYPALRRERPLVQRFKIEVKKVKGVRII